MKAIGYTRCSTNEQADSGLGLEAQAGRIRAYCTMRGSELLDVITDAGVSGGKPLASRDGGQRLLTAIRERKADAVVMLKLDRMFRNAGDCLTTVEKWEKAGVALHVVDLGGNAIDTTSMNRPAALVVSIALPPRSTTCKATPAFSHFSTVVRQSPALRNIRSSLSITTASALRSRIAVSSRCPPSRDANGFPPDTPASVMRSSNSDHRMVQYALIRPACASRPRPLSACSFVEQRVYPIAFIVRYSEPSIGGERLHARHRRPDDGLIVRPPRLPPHGP